MKVGNTDINNPKIGSNYIEKVYSGSDLVYERTFTTLLDNLTGSTGGFSLRRLNSSYTGSAIQVRRTSDNSTLDIGFVNNELDTASLTTFCTGTDGYVTTWYNQGSGADVTQSTASRQPKIYEASTGVQTENGKSCLLFDGVNDTLTAPNNFGNIGDCISFFTVVNGNTGSFPTIVSKSYDETGAYAIGTQSNSGYLNAWVETDRVNDFSLPNVSGSQILITNINKTGANNIKFYTNAALYSEYTTTQDLIGTNVKEFRIGSNDRDNNYYWDGNMQEILMFDNDQTANRTTIGTDINNYYRIY